MRLFYPLDENRFYISQKFGLRPWTYTISKGHNGVDWGVPVGNKIYAMMDGEVTVAEEQRTGYGRHVRITHPEGVSIYGHLSKLLVKKGDMVKAKQVIGLSGGATNDLYSGYSTGPHLHAEFRLNSGAPQVPGGYIYGAIDILPLLVCHSFAGENAKPIYSISMIYNNLIVRGGPNLTYPDIRNAGYGIFGVYEEVTGYGRINKYIGEWVNLDAKYSIRVEPVEPPETLPEPTDKEKLAILWKEHLERKP